MKNKNILLFGAIGVALYYLLKKDKASTVRGTTSTTSTTKPTYTQPYQKFEFSKEDLMRKDRTILLTEDVGMTKRMGAVLEYKLPYRGGARPTAFMERTSGMWIVKGNLPNLKTTKVCEGSDFDVISVGMPFDDQRNCVMVARTEDVVNFIFSSDMKWKVKFGKPVSNSDVMFPSPNPPAKFPTMGMNNTYGVPSGISLKR